MASKEILRHNGNIVPEINDSASTQFGGYEVYSRDHTDKLHRNPPAATTGRAA